ncbi:MAG: IclR family transcriptional regulator [Desulfocapsaceae bacterium]
MNPLSKVFSILEIVVSRQHQGMTYSDILFELNLPRSSVHRILKDLTSLKYLNFNPDTKRYFGSLRLAALGAEVMANFQLRDYTHPFLVDLHQETDHAANLGILDGIHGVYIDKVESRDFGVKLFSEIGKTFPLHCTALGKVLLSYAPPDVYERLIEQPLQALTEKTITDPARLRRELELTAERGYALDSEEITRGIICVAGPVFGLNRVLIGAVSVAFPASLDYDRGIEPEIIAIKSCAARISQSLGGTKLAAMRQTT